MTAIQLMKTAMVTRAETYNYLEGHPIISLIHHWVEIKIKETKHYSSELERVIKPNRRTHM